MENNFRNRLDMKNYKDIRKGFLGSKKKYNFLDGKGKYGPQPFKLSKGKTFINGKEKNH